MTALANPVEFSLRDSSIAILPAEQRGAGRDDVRLMVTHRSSESIDDQAFASIHGHLKPGDVVVVNTSATVPAAVDANTEDGSPIRIHFASPGTGGLWTLEVRRPTPGGGTEPGPDLDPQRLTLPDGAAIHLLARNPRTPRLWVAAVETPTDVPSYLEENGQPIRYTSGPTLSLAAYQTIFATEPGSAEMPSAARPFTPELVAALVSKGVAVVPITLHAGVSSYEEGETPGEERYTVPTSTATAINALRSSGGRVIAVGTTVVRAIESTTDDTGIVHPGRGVTDLVITRQRGVRGVDGLLTGWHEPRSSHLRLLEAFMTRDHLETVYTRARLRGYLWHEFGDVLLILP